ncbi:hypothetical protein [Desulfonema magnum]|uniref:Uncharacterized protein n=1 Tax=Desulfonema magnum TaxID=45655 RepID=A0A975GSM0_9BACT|nr:hypothetical protein [Desulfonema magnum]QTA92052.1 Uncharacterized protein dnm_081260 [Desulfonema magnum]
MPFLHANDLLINDFTELVRNASFPDDAILMAFSPADARFALFEFDEPFLSETDQGRIFSPNGELKWRRTGHKMRVVYLGNDLFDGLEEHSEEMVGLTSEQSEFILWRIGIDKNTKWIYKKFSDKKSDKKVVLIVEKWLDSSGLPRFSRYHSLGTIKEEKNAAK